MHQKKSITLNFHMYENEYKITSFHPQPTIKLRFLCISINFRLKRSTLHLKRIKTQKLWCLLICQVRHSFFLSFGKIKHRRRQVQNYVSNKAKV